MQGTTIGEMDQAKAAENHLRVLLRGMEAAGGFLELRSVGKGGPKSFSIPVSADDDDIKMAIKFAERESKAGKGIFVGVNPRAVDGFGRKADIKQLTTAFLDLDLEKRGISTADAIADIQETSPIPPDLITESGGGLHVLYFMRPTDDYEKWVALQETLFDKFSHLGADQNVVSDSSRILRLTPYPNYKYEDGPRQTGIVSFTAKENVPSIDTTSHLFDVKGGTGKAASPSGLSRLPSEMPEGGVAGVESGEGRNTLLFKEASRLRSRGYELEEMLPALLKINERRASPPLSESEVEAIAKSAARYDRGLILGTSEDYRTGRFGYKFRDFLNEDYPPLDWIIHGLNNGELGMLNAAPNVGKSTIILNLLMSMATGREYYPMYEGVGGTARRVMYLDFENRGGFLQKDVRQMSHMNFNEIEREQIGENLFVAVDQEIYGMAMNLSNPDHLDIVAKEAINHRADLIVIDTLAAAFALSNENDNSEAERVVVKPLKELSRKTGAAVLVIHHIGKAGETGDRSKLYAGRGASAFAAAARLVMNMEPMKDGSGRRIENHVVLSSPKVKGPPFDDTVFELDMGRRWFEAADIVLPDDASSQELIWEFVTHPMKRKEIVEAIREAGHDISDSTITRALKLGLMTGRLTRGAASGQYAPRQPDDDGILEADLVMSGGDESIELEGVRASEAEEGEISSDDHDNT